MDNFTLYNAPQSTCSQRVRYCLHAKKIDFEERKLDLFNGDQLKPEYLKINPNGVVPALVHGDKSITDSSVILEYLEDILPHITPLRPKKADSIATIRAMMRFIDEVPGPAIRIPSYNLAFLPHYQSMSEEEFQSLCDSKPLRREFLMKMGRTGFPETDMNEALERLRRGIERVGDWLTQSNGPWLNGKELTIADIAIMPIIVRMADINLKCIWNKLPMIEKWYSNIQSSEHFRATFYHGSLLTEKYPHLANVK